MRDRAQTIAHLTALAERPSTPAEGETARRKLREMRAKQVAEMVYEEPGLDASRFSAGTRIYYNLQKHRPNRAALVCADTVGLVDGEAWMRLRFDDRKYPVTACVYVNGKTYISLRPLGEDEIRELHGMA